MNEKVISVICLFSIFLLQGCNEEVVEEKIPEEITYKQEVLPVEVVPQKNMQPCEYNTKGLSFEYPDDWLECGEANFEENYWSIKFTKKFNEFETSLVASIRKVNEEDARKGGYFETDHNEVTEYGDLRIYPAGCGGGFFCNGVSIADKYFYQFGWDVKSTQPVPENLTEIWRPNHDFARDDALKILKSIKRVENPL